MNQPDTPQLISPTRLYGPNGLTTLSRTTIWRLIRQGAFPKPVRCTPNRNAFYLHEVHAWLDALPRAFAEGAA